VFKPSRFLIRSCGRGVKKPSGSSPTWFSTFPVSQPEASHRFDQIVATHLQEAVIVATILANEDCLHAVFMLS
jgi:hypothetical protein